MIERSKNPFTKARLLTSVAIFSLALCFVAMKPGCALSQEKVTGEVNAKENSKFGRIIFNFNIMPKYSHMVTDSILILKFKESVQIDLDKLSNQIPNYISVARLDPDGHAIRIAMTRNFRINLMEAGSMLFLDVLPPEWVGLPPSLPKKVIDDLAKKVAEIESKAREEARQLRLAKDYHKLSIRVGKHPTFSRIVFDWNKFVTANLSRDGKSVRLKFGKYVPVDVTNLKVDPPRYLQGVTIMRQKDEMEFLLTVNPEANVRGFREGYTYIVDLEGHAADVDISAEKFAEKAKKVAKNSEDGDVADKGSVKASEEIKLEGTAAEKSKDVAIKIDEDKPFDTKSQDFQPESFSPDAFADWDTTVESSDTQPFGMPDQVHSRKAGDNKARNKELAAVESAPKSTRPQAGTAKPEKQLEALAEVTPQAQPGNGSGRVKVAVSKSSDGLRLAFPFGEPVAAAAFRRANTIWIFFDSMTDIDFDDIRQNAKDFVKHVELNKTNGVQYLRIKLVRPWLIYSSQKDNQWVFSIGDLVTGKSTALHLRRGLSSDKRSIVKIDYKSPGRIHWIKDPEIGDRFAVVTAFGPTRSITKSQKFVDFEAVTSAHGIVVKPYTDDLAIRLRLDDVLITRNKGLTLSAGLAHSYSTGRKSLDNGKKTRIGFIDFKKWRQGGWSKFVNRTGELERAIAQSEKKEKNPLRLELARLYMSYEMAPEVLGVVKQISNDDPGANSDPSFNILRGVANTLMNRNKKAIEDLSVHALINDSDASLWRGLANFQEENWVQALGDFRLGTNVIDGYPYNLQARFRLAASEAALEANIIDRAAEELDLVPGVHLPEALSTRLDLLRGRYLDKIGRTDEAVEAYSRVIDSDIRPNVAKAKYRKIRLLLKTKKIDSKKAIQELESLAIRWRGDKTELRTLRNLANLYVQEGRYRPAFEIMKNAILAFPKDKLAMQIQDEMKEVFSDIFLHGKAEKLSPIASLSLYYDYKELTPIGRMGDEMIRRLANRLMKVDLLDQASELLDHQVNNRLRGAARAQVATRLSMVYLMNRKPALALRSIRHTRQPDLPTDLRRARDILEARALGELGRVEGAIDILSRHNGEDVERLKADAFWNAQRWLKAGEQLERNLGSRWQQAEALSDDERFDVLRAAISYSLADDQFGLDRLRKKFYPKMLKSKDAESFVLVTNPVNAKGKSFREVVNSLAGGDTLAAFIKQFKKDLTAHREKMAPYVPPNKAVSGAAKPAS